MARLSVASILLLALQAASFPLTKRAINGPVITSNFPDPSFIKVGDTYYAFATNGAVMTPWATSTDFTNWAVQEGSALSGAGSWSNGKDVWAPSVVQIGDKFVMYYSAQVNDGSTHCVGVATASSPSGPYEPATESLACPSAQGGAIDANGFQDADGSNYVLYKIDGNSIGHGGSCGNTVDPIVPTPIMLQKLNADGTGTDGSAPVQILDRGDADGPLVEAPSLTRVADDSSAGGFLYILFFSSNCYSSEFYDVSYAFSTNGIAGPYTKAQAPVAPLLQTGTPAANLFAPGGLSIDATGNQVVFMADQGNTADVRQMYSGTVNIDVAGRSVSI